MKTLSLPPDHDRLVRKAAGIARRHSRMDPDDLLNEAAVGLIEALSMERNDRLATRVVCHLIDRIRQERRQTRATTDHARCLAAPQRRERFDVARWAGELSDDARLVVGLLLEAGEDLPAGKIKRAVAGYLSAAGWGETRLLGTFGEIREALV